MNFCKNCTHVYCKRTLLENTVFSVDFLFVLYVFGSKSLETSSFFYKALWLFKTEIHLIFSIGNNIN
jgi:hypothetical protein